MCTNGKANLLIVIASIIIIRLDLLGRLFLRRSGRGLFLGLRFTLVGVVIGVAPHSSDLSSTQHQLISTNLHIRTNRENVKNN